MTKLKHRDDRVWGIASTASMMSDQNRDRGDSGIQASKIRALWASGFSNGQIADTLNLSTLDVNLALGRYDRGAE